MEELKSKVTARNKIVTRSQTNGNVSGKTTIFIFRFLESYMLLIFFVNIQINAILIRKYYILAKTMKKHFMIQYTKNILICFFSFSTQ